MDLRFDLEDASQVIAGSFSLAVPVAFTEEAWQLGESLPAANVALVVALSVAVFAFFALQHVFSGDVRWHVWRFVGRLVVGYGLALGVVALVLLSLDQLPLVDAPIVALRRVLIVGMPAAMGAIIVDGLDKESFEHTDDAGTPT